jgi:thymidylate kinase
MIKASAMLERPVIVEFLGLSGAGKSAVSHHVAERLRRRGLPVREPMLALAPPPSRRSLWKRTIKTLHVARELALHPRSSLRMLKSMRSTRQRRLHILLRMGFNWLMLSSLMRSHRPSLYLFDQGTFQALWSLALEGRLGTLRDAGAELVDTVPAPDVVVVVEATADEVLHRLKIRGGSESRADRWDAGAIRRSLRAMDEVTSILRSRSARPGGPRVLRVANGRNVDVRAVADRLAAEIERVAEGTEPVGRIAAR